MLCPLTRASSQDKKDGASQHKQRSSGLAGIVEQMLRG